MKNLLHSAKFLLLDMASTVFFLALFLLTGSIPLSVACGIALGIAQIAWEVLRRRPIDTMQWVSLIIILASGSATLLTHDPRFMMFKLSVIYVFVAAAMLKRGWMDRYLPPEAVELVPDLAVTFGYVWAGMMLLSAGINLVAATTMSVAGWAAFMSAFGIASKCALFLVQFSTMRIIGARRFRARQGLVAA